MRRAIAVCQHGAASRAVYNRPDSPCIANARMKAVQWNSPSHPMKSLFAPAALLADGWETGVAIVVDDAGRIERIERGAHDAADERLAGAVDPRDAEPAFARVPARDCRPHRHAVCRSTTTRSGRGARRCTPPSIVSMPTRSKRSRRRRTSRWPRRATRRSPSSTTCITIRAASRTRTRRSSRGASSRPPGRRASD